jgi:hypothetical protein
LFCINNYLLLPVDRYDLCCTVRVTRMVDQASKENSMSLEQF